MGSSYLKPQSRTQKSAGPPASAEPRSALSRERQKHAESQGHWWRKQGEALPGKMAGVEAVATDRPAALELFMNHSTWDGWPGLQSSASG